MGAGYPLIGLSCGTKLSDGRQWYQLAQEYSNAVSSLGGIPLMLTGVRDEDGIAALLARLDGLIFTGGGDIDPALFGEEPMIKLGEIDPERDQFEIKLAREALNQDIPVLGICRGIQVLNVAAGGSLYQDLASQVKTPLKHFQDAPRWYPTHEVKIERNSILASLYSSETLRVNSFHHQAVKAIGEGFRISAKSRDSVVEAIEKAGDTFVMGVQWHPECMFKTYEEHRLLFEVLVDSASRRRARQ